MKMIWKGIKVIISIKTGNIEAILYLKDKNGSKLSDPVKIATEFSTNILLILLLVSQSKSQELKSPLDYFSTSNLESFFISPSTPDEVCTLVKSLKVAKSTGLNIIP